MPRPRFNARLPCYAPDAFERQVMQVEHRRSRSTIAVVHPPLPHRFSVSAEENRSHLSKQRRSCPKVWGTAGDGARQEILYAKPARCPSTFEGKKVKVQPVLRHPKIKTGQFEPDCCKLSPRQTNSESPSVFFIGRAGRRGKRRQFCFARGAPASSSSTWRSPRERPVWWRLQA